MFCTKCGKPVSNEANFCIACGTAMSMPNNSSGVASNPNEAVPSASSADISWGVVAANFLGMLVIAYMTYPFPSELKSSGAPIYLLIRFGAPAFFAAVVTAIFYAFRKKKEGRLLKRSFVIATWVFLGLIVLGERS